MLRKTLLALCLLGAVLAATASAAGATPLIQAASYSAKLKSTSVLASVFRTPNAAFKCKGVSLTGTLAAASSTLTLTPTYSECTFFEAGVSANSNGCTYQLHMEKEVEKGFETASQGALDIVCPAGKSIQFFSAGKLCSWSYGAQTALARVVLENQFKSTPDDLTLYFEVTGLKVTETSSSPQCGSGTFTNGTLEGAVTVQAETEKGVGQDLWVK